MIHAQKVWPVRLWKQVPMEEIADAAVIALKQADQETLTGLCGKDKHYVFTIRDGKLTPLCPPPQLTSLRSHMKSRRL